MIDKNIRAFLWKRFKEEPKIEKLQGGANNQVYQVTLKNSDVFVLKKYFYHPTDTRDRLFHELSFLQYAQTISLESVCKPIAFCLKDRIGLYSKLPGRNAKLEDVTKESIEHFLTFFQKINSHKNLASHLPLAIDRTLCIKDHLYLIEKRVKWLLSIEIHEEIDKEMLLYVNEQLLPRYLEHRERLFQNYKSDHRINNIPIDHLCISPSDFGFHNVLIADTSLYFYDFEYAGFDDPVNLLANFFCQPKIPISQDYLPMVSKSFLSFLPNPEEGYERFSYIHPLCLIKWALLILNIFHRPGGKRRAFSGIHEKKSSQLELSKNYFKNSLEILID